MLYGMLEAGGCNGKVNSMLIVKNSRNSLICINTQLEQSE